MCDEPGTKELASILTIDATVTVSVDLRCNVVVVDDATLSSPAAVEDVVDFVLAAAVDDVDGVDGNDDDAADNDDDAADVEPPPRNDPANDDGTAGGPTSMYV